MTSARILREKIQREQLTVGVIATHHFWIDLIEIARNAGMDFIVIDQEHMAFDEQLVADACALGRLIDFPILIRPPECSYTLIRRALDKGAVGLMIPQVDSLEALQEIHAGIYMPPRGRRRVGGPGNRWVPDFNHSTWKKIVEDELIILPQIESRWGLGIANDIARDDCVTALAAGPYDLSSDLGVCWQPDAPILVSALDEIRAAARSAGKNMMMVGDGATLIARGFSFICIAEPTCFLEAALKSHVSSLRSGPQSAPEGKAFVP